MRYVSLTVVALAFANSIALANVEQDCFQSREPHQRIDSCTEIIQRDPTDATAYHNRAVAHGLAGDVDSAISDFSKVIEIAPNNATAYENRGKAYASKGDYASAVADETKAAELMTKANAASGATAPISNVAQPKKSTSRRVTASTDRATQTRRRPQKPSRDVGDEVPQPGLWSWLWGAPDQAKGKPGKQ